MVNLKFNSLINLKLTQESGQTSQAPWRYNSVGDNDQFSELIYLNTPSIINELSDETINLNKLPVLLKLSQDKNDLNSFTCLYQLPKKVEKKEFSLNIDNFSKHEINIIENEIKNELTKIYNLDFDLEKFYDFLLSDEKLAPSVDFCNGLRLFIAKDPFECIISSICSANNSILRWTKSIDKIKSNWGEKVEFDDGMFYGFPSPKQFLDFYETPIEEADEDGHCYEIDCYTHNLKACGVGYRAPYMKKASQILIDDINIDEIFSMGYEEAFDLILGLPGVGPKVADCILLYGFGFEEAFPSDVWIKRIVSHLYFDGEISAEKTREFGIEHFGDYAGYAQLYLFHYARKSGLMDKIKK
ncbi:DNA glycosylase [Methanobrevibacter sp.]|uniref:DNA glycosylase n=1 Tax=Methanobrevibacter sp. TaxID=66852 RepID=UPI0025F2FE2C|nr:DNA glycosylase [Methanobrevibacter sp.]MBQ2962359.1 3-methyladenine DNA glycosylase [Methanobrevibacter sp.]